VKSDVRQGGNAAELFGKAFDLEQHRFNQRYYGGVGYYFR
jgi:hypothetical protein